MNNTTLDSKRRQTESKPVMKALSNNSKKRNPKFVYQLIIQLCTW